MSRIVARAESWENVYQAFQNVNFAAFDYNTVKQSLIDYLKLHFAESFNDFIESSEHIAIIESFCYVAELLAYRMDVNAHENFISSAQRKESILRLAKLISYTPSRQLPARGLVKITSVTTTEAILDAAGSSLAGKRIRWNDPNNPVWKDQFFAVINRVLEQQFGTVGPTDRFQVQDVLFELYATSTTPLTNGVLSYTALVDGQREQMELVAVARSDQYGIVERRPSNGAPFTLLYGQDGLGDASTTTGFFCYTKQGSLQRFRQTFDGITPNQTYDIPATNINDTDVWVNAIDPDTGLTKDDLSKLPYKRNVSLGKSGEWVQVDMAHAQNIIFNTNPKRNKYEVETLVNNGARLIFGDGEFADVPGGTFDVWARSSVDRDIVVPQSAVVDVPLTISYVDLSGKTQSFTFTFSLINSLQNASASEDMEHVRTAAPAVYYSQDRMVNGEDYNTFMRQDPSIYKLRAVNRTFAGDSKYIAWHDPSTTYENVKMCGNDGMLYFEDQLVSITTDVIDTSSLVTNHIEPLLASTDIYVQLASRGAFPTPYRRTFNTAEKTRLAAALTPPPSPVQVDMYFNHVDDQWYAVKSSDDLALTLPNWPTAYVSIPLITIRQYNVLETRYVVSRMARRMTFQSPSTMFWTSNDSNRVLDYDTNMSSADTVVIMKANINGSRNGLITSDKQYSVLGLQQIDAGEQLGLEDIHRISVLPADSNGDGVPDLVNTQSQLSSVVTEVLACTSFINVPASIDAAAGVAFQLPVSVLLDTTNSKGTSDVRVFTPSGIELQGYDLVWRMQSPTGSYASNTLVLRDTVFSHVPVGTQLRVEITEHVYFTRATVSDSWQPVPTNPAAITAYALNQLDQTSLWKRAQGRGELNFMWHHYTPRYHLVDPAPTNINDMFILTKGYFNSLRRWLEDPIRYTKPADVTPLDLRTTYGYLLDNKMVSDDVILHPGRVKLLFGKNAIPSLQGTFRVIRSSDRTLTDNQIKNMIVTTVREFFNPTQWEFGESFYFTELVAALHNALPTEISSIVLVPTMGSSQFGDMFQVSAREDEILYADIDVTNIEVVTGYTATNLRLTPSQG